MAPPVSVQRLLAEAKSPTLRLLWTAMKPGVPAGMVQAEQVHLLLRLAERRGLWATIGREVQQNHGSIPNKPVLPKKSALLRAKRAKQDAKRSLRVEQAVVGKATKNAHPWDAVAARKGSEAPAAKHPVSVRDLGWFGPGDGLPRPESLIGKKPMSDAEKKQIVAYLAKAPVIARAKHQVFCALCQKQLGSGIQTDGTYRWPEGLAHYVGVHKVVLPASFTKAVIARHGKPPFLHERELRAIGVPGAPGSAHFEREIAWWRKAARTENPLPASPPKATKATAQASGRDEAEGPRSGGRPFVRSKDSPSKASKAKAKARVTGCKPAVGGRPTVAGRRHNPVASYSEDRPVAIRKSTVDQLGEGISVGTLEDAGVFFDSAAWEPEEGVLFDKRFDASRPMAAQKVTLYDPPSGAYGGKARSPGKSTGPGGRRLSNPLPPGPPGAPRGPGGVLLRPGLRLDEPRPLGPRTPNPLRPVAKKKKPSKKGRLRNPIEGSLVVVPERKYKLIAGPEKGLKSIVVVEDTTGDRVRYKIMSTAAGEWSENFRGEKNAVTFAQLLEQRAPDLLREAAKGNFTSDLRVVIETLRANLSQGASGDAQGAGAKGTGAPPQVQLHPIGSDGLPKDPDKGTPASARLQRDTLLSAAPAPGSRRPGFDALGPNSSPTSNRLQHGPSSKK